MTFTHSARNLSKVGSLKTLILKYNELPPLHLETLTASPDQDEKVLTEWASVDHYESEED